MKGRLIYQLAALLLACNYFAFQTELFDDEYNENHPAASSESSYTVSSLNWESFDKDHAQKAFVFEPELRLTEIKWLQPPIFTLSFCYTASFHAVRDKSPPTVIS